MNLIQERLNTLTAAAEARAREIMHYQINIDNYSRAIVEIGDDPAMQDFAMQLRDLLTSSRIEQAKEQILLKVIRDQLEEAACTSS